jgi:hypothetical protein
MSQRTLGAGFKTSTCERRRAGAVCAELARRFGLGGRAATPLSNVIDLRSKVAAWGAAWHPLSNLIDLRLKVAVHEIRGAEFFPDETMAASLRCLLTGPSNRRPTGEGRLLEVTAKLNCLSHSPGFEHKPATLIYQARRVD